MFVKEAVGKVAVVTSLYNGDDIVLAERALVSLIDQDYGRENIDIYIHIDGPVDDEHKQFIELNSGAFSKILYSEKNIGLAKGLNRLFEYVDAKYIFRMDLDDVSDLDRFSKQVDYMENNPDVGICGCNTREIDINGKVECYRQYPENHKDVLKTVAKLCPVLHPTFCIRSQLIADGLRYPDYYLTEDLGLIYEVLKTKWRFGNLQETLFSWTKGPGFYSRRNFKRSYVEMYVYFKIIRITNPYSFDYFYPMTRFLFRMFPRPLVEFVYHSKLRNFLAKN